MVVQILTLRIIHEVVHFKRIVLEVKKRMPKALPPAPAGAAPSARNAARWHIARYADVGRVTGKVRVLAEVEL